MNDRRFIQAFQIFCVQKNETDNPPVAEVVVETQDGASTGGGSGVASEYLNAILIGLVVVLVLILLVLGFMISVLTRYVGDKKDLDEDEIISVTFATVMLLSFSYEHPTA